MCIYLTMGYVTLQTEEIEALENPQKNSIDNTVRKRSQCLLLSHQKRTITDLTDIFGVNRRTIERWFDNWARSGINSLAIQPGRGVKARLSLKSKRNQNDFELKQKQIESLKQLEIEIKGLSKKF